MPSTDKVTPIVVDAPATSEWTPGVLEARDGEHWQVRCGDRLVRAAASPPLDESLLDACLADGRPVLLRDGPEPTLLGALQTQLAATGFNVARREVAAGESLTLRAGKAAIVLHADGTIALKGQRLLVDGQSAVSLQGGQVTLA